ncbi:MAG TPA: SUMF1/EgtB/PvdO family nonheme iron enzyme [Pirellulales bacterium]|nr:SUMF1/EgtB/PvdO family nonheme iron enzyme [Pirellulales bacterium]
MQVHRILPPWIFLFAARLTLECSLAHAGPPSRPLPAAAELKSAESRVMDAVRAKLTAQGKSDDVQAWFDDALGRQDDPVGQCALLIRVRELARAAGEVSLALAAIDALGERFEFDVLASKAPTLEDLAKTARATPSRRQSLEAGARLTEEALAAERYELAERFAKAAAIAANYDQELRRQTRVLTYAVNFVRTRAEKQRQAAADARERLQSDPDDLQAHAALGLHCCFAEQNWAEGLKSLEKSADSQLIALARLESAPPQDARGRLALADAWWSAALDPARADQRARFVLRAAHWYRRASAGLDGQAKAKAEDRASGAISAIAWGDRLAARRFTEAVELPLTENVVLRLVKVPRGNARNGALESFYLSETEITQEQWLTLMPENPSSQRGDGLLPVHDLTHEQAVEFAQALNRAEIAEDYRFRLPAPAEWLHACLGCYSVRDSRAREMVDRQAWRQTNSEGRLHPVAALSPNGWSLFDMLGNCAEWTTDANRVFGFSYADRIHAAKLFQQPPVIELQAGHHAPTIGFRIAADRR